MAHVRSWWTQARTKLRSPDCRRCDRRTDPPAGKRAMPPRTILRSPKWATKHFSTMCTTYDASALVWSIYCSCRSGCSTSEASLWTRGSATLRAATSPMSTSPACSSRVRRSRLQHSGRAWLIVDRQHGRTSRNTLRWKSGMLLVARNLPLTKQNASTTNLFVKARGSDHPGRTIGYPGLNI